MNLGSFLIDKNKIIQWAGHASRLTPEILESFLKYGVVNQVEVKLEDSQNNDIVGFAKQQMSLMRINEQKLDNRAAHFLLKRFEKDSFQFISNYNSLGEVITSIFGDQSKRVIYKNIPLEITNKKISVEYSAINVNTEGAKIFLLNCIGNSYHFTARTENLDTLVMEIFIKDSVKLNNYKTVLTYRPGNSWIYNFEGTKNENGFFTFLNFTAQDLAKKIENEFGLLCTSIIEDNAGYDFYKLNGANFEAMSKELLDKYGISFSIKKAKVQVLVVENKHNKA